MPSGCGRGAGRDPPPPPPPPLPPPPATRSPTRTRTPRPSRSYPAHAHPFLELPSPPSHPQPVASRRAHAPGSLPPRRPTPAPSPAWWHRENPGPACADLLLGLPPLFPAVQSDRARGTGPREPVGGGPADRAVKTAASRSPRYAASNGRSELRVFALGKMRRSPVSPALRPGPRHSLTCFPSGE